jgi:hypothetical protein
MSRSHSIDLIIYSAILTVVGWFAMRYYPETAKTTSIVIFPGAGACLTWGILGVRGLQSRVGPIITLITLATFLLLVVVKQWLVVRAGNDDGKNLAVLNTVMLGFAVIQLVNIKCWRDDNRHNGGTVADVGNKHPQKTDP